MNESRFYLPQNLETYWHRFSRWLMEYPDYYKRFVRPQLRPITEEARYQYWVRCQNCVYSRGYGTAKLTATTKASAHSLRKMHIVHVQRMDLKTLNTEVIQESSPKVTSKQLPVDPPF